MNPGNGRFTQQDSWAGSTQRPSSLNKYVYAESDSVNSTDPSGRMSLNELTATQNIQSTLSVVSRGERLLRMYDKVQTMKQLVLGVAMVIQYANASGPDFKSALPKHAKGINFGDAADSFVRMSGQALARGMSTWVPQFALSLARGRKLSAYVLYMPTFGKLPSRLVSTGVKIDGVALKLGFGGPANKFGSMMGLGIEMAKERQLMRMDYHPFNEGHGGPSGVQPGEIAVLREEPWHMHVFNFEGGGR